MLKSLGLFLMLAIGMILFKALPSDSPVPTRRPSVARAAFRPAPVKPKLEQRAGVYAFIASRAGKAAAGRLTDVIVEEAAEHEIPPLLVAKVVNRESSFHTRAANHGCYGLMQVASFHFKHGQSPVSARDNLHAGCKVLAGYHKRFGNWPQALTAYNFGPGATVSRGLGTSRYARMVLEGR